MKYNFLTKYGELKQGNSLNKLFDKMTWEKLNNLRPLYSFTKEQKEFLTKWGFDTTIFNVGILQNLGVVYLTNSDLKRIIQMKGGLIE